MAAYKNSYNNNIRYKKRRGAPACRRRRRRGFGGEKKKFLLLEFIERRRGDPRVIIWTFHEEAMRGTVTELHSVHKRYLRRLYKRTHDAHARAHARAKAKVKKIVNGRGPKARIHDLFLLGITKR